MLKEFEQRHTEAWSEQRPTGESTTERPAERLRMSEDAQRMTEESARRPTEERPTEVRPTEERPTEVRPTEERPTEENARRLTEERPTEENAQRLTGESAQRPTEVGMSRLAERLAG